MFYFYEVAGNLTFYNLKNTPMEISKPVLDTCHIRATSISLTYFSEDRLQFLGVKIIICDNILKWWLNHSTTGILSNSINH